MFIASSIGFTIFRPYRFESFGSVPVSCLSNPTRRNVGFPISTLTALKQFIESNKPVCWIKITDLLPAAYNPETYIPFGLPGLGLLIVCIFMTFIGALTAGILGRFWVRTSEKVLSRMPVIRSVYGALKQIFETVLSKQSDAFREVVLFEYPRRGSWALGFITGKTEGEIQSSTEDEIVNVFLPTTPNPTSGYLLFVPRRELVVLSMTVEEGIKMVISGGIVTPPDRRAPEERKIKVASADGDTKTILSNDD